MAGLIPPSEAILDLLCSLENWVWNAELKEKMMAKQSGLTKSQAARILEKYCHIDEFKYAKPWADDLLDSKMENGKRYFKTKQYRLSNAS